MFPDPPKLKVGDFVRVHNRGREIFKICYVIPATEPGKSHRYYYKDLWHKPGKKPIIHTGVKGYYESGFTLTTDRPNTEEDEV